jgi:hypothetical protein
MGAEPIQAARSEALAGVARSRLREFERCAAGQLPPADRKRRRVRIVLDIKSHL